MASTSNSSTPSQVFVQNGTQCYVIHTLYDFETIPKYYSVINFALFYSVSVIPSTSLPLFNLYLICPLYGPPYHISFLYIAFVMIYAVANCPNMKCQFGWHYNYSNAPYLYLHLSLDQLHYHLYI